MSRFGGLSTVANILSILGWISVVGGGAAILSSLSQSSNELQAIFGVSLIGSGLVTVLGAGAVSVLIAIEENTRSPIVPSSETSEADSSGPSGDYMAYG
jgi:hypothetical protein